MTMNQLANFGILPTWDLGLVLFLLLVILFYEVSSAKSRFLLTLLSTYFSFLIVDFFPFWEALKNILKLNDIFYLKILFFLIFIFLFSFLLSSSALGSIFSFGKKKIGYFFQIFLFSILQTGLLVSLGFSFLPEKYYGDISVFVKKIFLEDFSRFLWILLPIIALLIFRKRSGKNK